MKKQNTGETQKRNNGKEKGEKNPSYRKFGF